MLPARPHLFGMLAGLFLATGLVLAAFLVARAWTRLSETNVVNVTGSARKNVRSDLIVWRTCFHVDAATLPAAQRQLQEQLAQATAHLAQSGLTDVAVAPVEVQELTVRARDADGEEATVRRVGYRLLQRLEIRSTDVERVPRLAADTSALIEQGIVFSAHEFQFIYTKAGEAKVEMMAEATKDARARRPDRATGWQRGRRTALSQDGRRADQPVALERHELGGQQRHQRTRQDHHRDRDRRVLPALNAVATGAGRTALSCSPARVAAGAFTARRST